ncbi:hypothetical protein SERLADRAFT_411134 [Serpula lacrymans var. lacrymans S7.9]|uniref:Uncharacterized protein n=1 Tax=Serpula lacrymans var. lacrymans (strain S7.9) TaxID=578457 RepID=F8P976_SERL9|nr:uncharacterized protein SERLADRAFT_411134 [Serpula lacrymans var. lacrymans S7.9]EGO20205.1 hypothetical protein SERLADRAFT_411134 [Serpula lacrymans var. lacrymans S7.9]
MHSPHVQNQPETFNKQPEDEQEIQPPDQPLDDQPQAQGKIEYHPFLDGQPCENGNLLPPGAKPVLPEAHGIVDQNTPFSNKDDLYWMIDSTSAGDVPWESFLLLYNGEILEENAPGWMRQEFDVWFRHPRTIVQNMLSNQDFSGEIDFVPYRKFNAKGEQEYKDFMSGKWAWKQADKISTDPTTHGSSFVPVILGSDKTTVSVLTGQNEYYPLYISVGNVHNNVWQAHRNAVVLLGFLAIPKTDKKYANDPKFCRFWRQLFHTSMSRILQGLKPGMHVIYGIGPYIANYPEQALLACIVQGWCSRCIALPNNLDGEGGQCSHDHTEVLADFLDPRVLRDQYCIPFTHDFPHADIHEILAPDLLHQVIKGTFKDHLVTWVEDYLNLMYGKKHAEEISDGIDQR